jgi:protein-L-isoaspartate(D-aspartate) O-methyltransferase
VTVLDQAFAATPADVYTHHATLGTTLHFSAPQSIRRELAALQVRAGDRVLEIGTGSGFSGALLAALCGPYGRVTSVDISDELIRRAAAINAERGVTGIDYRVTDGLAGYPAAAPYDRVVAWCTPPRLSQAWANQVGDGGRIVACLPITALPSITLITTITVTAGQPQVEAVVGGGYAQSTPVAVDDAQTVPGRWVDYCDHQPDPSWIGIGWRDHDDARHTGARAALDQLLQSGHTETYRPVEEHWRSWYTWTAALGDPQLSLVSLRNEIRGLGHTTASSGAVLLTDGVIIADSPTSPSLRVLRAWLQGWEHAGRPAVEAFTHTLVPYGGSGLTGWDLQVSHPAVVPALRGQAAEATDR